MRKIIFLILIFSLLLGCSACSLARVKDDSQESSISAESEEVLAETSNAAASKSGAEAMPDVKGNWAEENSDLHLTIQKNKLILCSGDMCRPLPYQMITEGDKILLIQSEAKRDFELISEICVQEDGSLTADEQGAAGEVKHYRFVREEESDH